MKKKWSQFCYKVLLQFHFLLLCILILIVWGALSLPIVFFNMPPERSNTGVTLLPANTSCLEDLVSLLPRTAGVCEDAVTKFQLSHNCSIPGTGILVPRSMAVQAQMMLTAFELLKPSEECRNEMISFLCLYFDGLCRDTEGIGQPTNSQCVNIRDNVCSQEWMMALNFNINFPDCTQLPSTSEFCEPIETSLQQNNTDTESLHQDTNKIVCSDGFFMKENSSICLPNCHSWFQYSRTLTITSDVTVILSAIVGVLISIIIITLSCLIHKKMLKFPSVLVLYMVIDTIIIGAFLIVSYTNRNDLYCSSLNLLESMQRVTPFCVISGIVLEYLLFQLALWWLFHIILLFLKILCPFHKISTKKSKYLHLSFVVVGLLLPLVPLITSVLIYTVDFHKDPTKKDSFISGGIGFGITRFPPILCYGKDRNALFYSFSLPIDLIVALGCTMLLIIIWSLHRQQIKMKITILRHPIMLGKPELKLLVVCAYYIIFVGISLTSLTLSTRNFEPLQDAIMLYFACEQQGYNPEHTCSREDIQRLTYPFMTTLSFVFINLFPVINLIYVLNIKEAKEILKKWRLKRSNKKLQQRSTEMSMISFKH